MLVRCLYASRAQENPPAGTLDRILTQSRRNNLKRGITGLLCHTPSLFVQVIEGGREEVSGLMVTIIKDERHRDLQLLLYEEIGERRFGNWSMGQVNIETMNPSLLLKYYERASLDPFRSSGRATMALLSELVATGAIVSRS